MSSLFQELEQRLELAQGLFLFRGLAHTGKLLADIEAVLRQAPLRQMSVPRGGKMSVAMSNCGALGWVSDAKGYRYSATDPMSGNFWPAIPKSFLNVAKYAGEAAGYGAFAPDACLVNRYTPGAALSLHQDRNEASFEHPIVSVSIGATAKFLWGGLRRQDPVKKLLLHDGDVLVWGGPVRLAYHGIAAMTRSEMPGESFGGLGGVRFNLTLRKAA